MCWLWLFLAIALEVTATVFLKLSDGFSRILPTVIMGVLYLLSFVPLALALKRMDIAIAYAVWSALGTALITLIGVVLFKESVTMLKVGSIALIVVGVVFLNLSSRATDRRPQNRASSVSVDVSMDKSMTPPE